MMKMNKKLALLIAAIMFTSAAGIQLTSLSYAEGIPGENLYKGKEQLKREREAREQAEQAQQQPSIDESEPVTDEQIFGDTELPVYYPKATMKSAVAKYKKHNYTGCIQELYSILKKEPENSLAYYYLAMSYVKAGKKDQALAAYQRVINLNKNPMLVEYSVRGKACVNGDASCTGASTGEGTDEMDEFIASPYGNGFSDEFNTDWKKMQLRAIQNKINNGKTLTPEEVEKMKQLNKSQILSTDKLAFADNGSKKNSKTPSNSEVLEALDVLKRAGVNISAQTASIQTEPQVEAAQKAQSAAQTPKVQPAQNPMAYTPDLQMQQMSMMLNGGNNTSPDPMMYMLPYMMNANNGQNIDPKVIQAMMMNSMMNSLNNMNPVNTNN